MQYDALHKADYLSIPSLNEFISYLGAQSIKDTVAWHKAQAFGGFMTYSLDYEYVSTQAGDALYPLSTALYNEVFGTVALPTGIPEARSRSSGALPVVGGQLRSNRP
jgi:GH18 family chitinase